MSNVTTREVDQITSLLPKLIDENTRLVCTQVLMSVIKLLLETHLDIDKELINIKIEIVDTIPSTSNADSNTIYLVKNESDEDLYDEYILVEYLSEPIMKKIGSTSVNLNNYYTKSQADSKFPTFSAVEGFAERKVLRVLINDDQTASMNALDIANTLDTYEMQCVAWDNRYLCVLTLRDIETKNNVHYAQFVGVTPEPKSVNSQEVEAAHFIVANVYDDASVAYKFTKVLIDDVTLLRELLLKADKNGDYSVDFNVKTLNLSHDTTLTNTGITKTEYHDTLGVTEVNINFPNESGTLALEENTVAKSEYETVKESYEELVGAITGEQFDVDNSSVNYGEVLTNFISNNTSVATATNALNDLQSQIASIATLDGDNSGTQLVARINKLVDDKGYVSTATFNDDIVASLQNATVETAVKLAAGYNTSVNGYVQTSSNETNTYEITNTGNEIDLYHKSQVTISGNSTAYKETWCKVTADEIKFYVDLQNNVLTEISAESVVAPKFIKNGGTSELILLADGSIITIAELIARINNNS